MTLDGKSTDLVHGQVAHVAEEDDVRVLTFAVHTDAAHGVLVDGRTDVAARRLALEERLLLEAVHDELEDVLPHLGLSLLAPLIVDQLQPRVILNAFQWF